MKTRRLIAVFVIGLLCLGLLFNGKVKGQAVGDILLCLFLPAIDKMRETESRTDQTQRNTCLASSLALYRFDSKRYPERLESLVPKYLSSVPDDLFTGKPLIYQPTENSYLLYSVGPNEVDDGGRGNTDEPRGDDLAVRMPLPPLPKK
jgi:hypothetical protein